MSEKMSLDEYRAHINQSPTTNKKGKRKINDFEHQAQVTIIEWCNLQAMTKRIPELEYIHAIPNGSKRPAGIGGYLKAEGVKAGVLDLFWDLPRGHYHGFRAELKVKDKNGRVNKASKEQVKWIDFYQKQGFHADVYVGADAVIDAIEKYYFLGEFTFNQS